jgi:hypothetical protein
MPSVTILKYEGTEEEISRFLAQNGHGLAAPKVSTATGQPASGIWDQVATKFEKYIRMTAAAGRPGQKNAMLTWLKADGKTELTKLWKAAGVKSQHDYAGVGGSLTKNMVKAGGPKDWYSWHVDNADEWHYAILPELVEPLKRAFGVS